jgi:SSS family transporter
MQSIAMQQCEVVVVFGTQNSIGRIDYRAIPAETLTTRSGAFVGNCGEAIVVAGGYNPDGSLSAELQVLAPGGQVWTTSTLQVPRAFGACAAFRDSLILAGGVEGQGVSSRVTKLVWSNGMIEAEALPDLPEPRMLAGAVVHGNLLYVAGGIGELNGSVASRDVYVLDLTAPISAWRQLEKLPGTGRIEPMVDEAFDEIIIAGGGSVGLDSEGAVTVTPLADAWGYRAKPHATGTQMGWRALQPLPQPLLGAAAHKSGQSHMMIFGGQSGPRQGLLPQAEPAGTVSTAVYAFHAITDTWVAFSPLPHALTGAQVVRLGGTPTLVAGMDSNSLQPKMLQVEMASKPRKVAVLDWGIVAGFFVLYLLIGWHFSKRQTSTDEYALGGRKMKWWAAAFSMFATGTSAISFMAIPAFIFSTNLVIVFPLVLVILVLPLQAYVMYPMLARLKLTSTFQYVEMRFNLGLRMVSASQCLLYLCILRTGLILFLPALAINAMTGFDTVTCVIIMGIVTTLFSTVGGFEAVVWTDMVQGLVLIGGMILTAVLALVALPGGLETMLRTCQAAHKFEFVILDTDMTKALFYFSVASTIMTALSFASDQQTAQRVLCVPLKEVRKLAFLNIGLGVGNALIGAFFAVALFAFFTHFPQMMDPTMSNDQVMPTFIVQKLPIGVVGLVLSALMAAAISTVSSAINSSAVIVAEDFYKRFARNYSSRRELLIMKITSLAVGLLGTGLAVLMATVNLPSVFELSTTVGSLLASGICGMYILGMVTRRANSGGILCGFAANIASFWWVTRYTDWHFLSYGVVSGLAMLIVGYFASFLFKRNCVDYTGLTMFDMISPDEVMKPTGSVHAAKKRAPGG